jgi:hypothetical protein
VAVNYLSIRKTLPFYLYDWTSRDFCENRRAPEGEVDFKIKMLYIGNATPYISCHSKNMMNICNNAFNITQSSDMNLFVQIFMMDLRAGIAQSV